MASMTEYYGRMKSGFGNINPKDMAQLGEDWMITAGAGAAAGLVSAALGGLDKKVFGLPVPVDGVMSVGAGLVGLSMGGESGRILKIASIALGGSAAVRTFEGFFRSGLHIKGDFEEVGNMMASGSPYGRLPMGAGFGVGAQDRLVEAARYL